MINIDGNLNDLCVDSFNPFINNKFEGILIEWHCNGIGYGQYTLYRNIGNEEWKADSEHMDNEFNKEFIKKIMEKFIERLNIEG